METIHLLETNGLVIKEIIVLIDREEGGSKYLKELGYNLTIVFNKNDLNLYLNENN